MAKLAHPIKLKFLPNIVNRMSCQKRDQSNDIKTSDLKKSRQSNDIETSDVKKRRPSDDIEKSDLKKRQRISTSSNEKSL